MRNAEEIVRDAGGGKAIAGAANKAGLKLGEWAPLKWPQNGIPDRYWGLMEKLAGATVGELFAANEAIRKGSVRKFQNSPGGARADGQGPAEPQRKAS